MSMEAESTSALIERMIAFEADHVPDGWPCIRMRDITALCDAVEAARAAALEEAAEVCEARKIITPQWQLDQHYNQAATHCAAAIRALAKEIT